MTQKETATTDTPSSPSGKATSDPVLPPLGSEAKVTDESPSSEGISPGLKRGIILFSVFTVLIFGVFGTLLVNKLLEPAKDKDLQADATLTVAKRLYEAGLHEQAIGQYEKFLSQPGIGRETRARVSFDAGKIYLELDNCSEGLVYLFQSQVAFAKAPWAGELTSHIDHCLTRLQSPPNK